MSVIYRAELDIKQEDFSIVMNVGKITWGIKTSITSRFLLFLTILKGYKTSSPLY